MTPTPTLSENSSTSEELVVEKTSIESVRDHSDKIVHIYADLLRILNIELYDFAPFLESFIQNNNLDENDIVATEFKEGSFILHLNSGGTTSFSLQDIHEYISLRILGESLETTETRVANINAAIESIYRTNYEGIFQGEIDDDDIVIGKQFGDNLEGKTLSELRELLDIETQKLYQVYKITGETEKREQLLKQEIEFFAGIGDKYEGGARYFSLSDEEIKKKVALLTQSMSIEEVFQYIISLNETIDENWRKSDMVNQINGKLTQALYTQTFDRLKNEERPDEDFIEFAKIVTGRAKIQREIIRNVQRGPSQSVNINDTINIDDSYKAFDIACKSLIYIMYRPGGVLETIQNRQEEEIVVEDSEVSDKEPQAIIAHTISLINGLAPNEEDYGLKAFEEAGLDGLVGTNKSYSELSFDEKINIGAIYRIGKLIEESSMEERSSPDFVKSLLSKTIMESYDELNDSFSDNFDGYNGFFGGKTSEDFGLEGSMAEIFDLYQDINGNSGFWDWSDKNLDTFGNTSTLAILGIGIIAGVIIFAPVLAAGTAATSGAMLLAGAQAGLVTGIASVTFSRQGFDTYYEAAVDSIAQIAADTALGAVFAWGGLSLIRKLRLNSLMNQYSQYKSMPAIQNYLVRNAPSNLSPDMFFSLSAWRGAGLADKAFILGEMGVLAGYVGPRVAREVRKTFDSNHYDSDTHRYAGGEIQERN